MNDTYHLSNTETKIMEKLWGLSEPIRQTQLLDMFREEGKEWGRQTLNTLLIRLEKRGFVKREKRMVWAAYNRKEYGALIIKEVVENYFDGKLDKAMKECRK